MTFYERVFGAGPRGLFISCAIIAVIYLFAPDMRLGQITDSEQVRIAFFVFSILVTIAISVWSVKSLPPKSRGEFLVTTGAFAYFRHPLYGAFLSFFNFGLALFLNDYIYMIWAILQHPIWHLNIISEEKLMLDKFGAEYSEYSRKVSRFFPLKKLLGKVV